MKKNFLCVFLLILFFSCEKKESNLPLNPLEKLSFSGTFETINSENISGTVLLNISQGYYECKTNLPYGNGAGKLEIDDSTLNFIDTLFFAIPSLYGPSYVLSGKHNYSFNGENLKIWKTKNVGEIIYRLTKKN